MRNRAKTLPRMGALQRCRTFLDADGANRMLHQRNFCATLPTSRRDRHRLSGERAPTPFVGYRRRESSDGSRQT